MNSKQAIIYISDNCPSCEKIIDKMDEWAVPYEIKNITQRSDVKEELQNLGVFGTPATFIKGISEPILGAQINKLKRVLNVTDH